MSASPVAVELPQVRAKQRGAPCGPVRTSRRGKWRALTLVLVHVAIAAHIIHWKIAGQTLAPLEPSEAIQTVRDGLVNAGFVLFGLAIAATLVFGRFFCGWACHLVAYQDACTWLLRKAGLRPKPFRSRLLLFVPLLAALYMFVFPLAYRFGFGLGWPHFEAHFYTDDFWRTFPSNIWISIFTFVVCGGLIVYLLGNKGFCTYACPYGGFFGPADTLAPGKIRVTDACEGCGHCTATCTSNVRVHEEVRLYGMVVDPGCMKCMDCVNVCPKDALYFGFGPPTLAKPRPRAAVPQREVDYSWAEELWLAALFLVGLYAFRGLYDLIPFLLALGMSAIAAFVLLTAARVFYTRASSLHRWQLRTPTGIAPAGWGLVVVSVALAALIGHSAYVQYHTLEGDYWMQQATTAQHAVPRDEVRRLSRLSLDHYQRATRAGLLTNHVAEARLGSLHLFFDEVDSAEIHLRRALAAAPDYADAHHKLAETLARRQQADAAINHLRAVFQAVPDRREAPRDLANLAIASGRTAAAIEILEQALRRRPRHTEARLELARLLLVTGNAARAEAEIERAVADAPESAEAHFRLALLRLDQRRPADARAALRATVERQPRAAPAWYYLGQIAAEEQRFADAALCFARAREIEPFNRDFIAAWVFALRSAGGLDAARDALRAAPADDLAARYALAFVYFAAGDEAAMRTAYEQVRAQRPELPPP